MSQKKSSKKSSQGFMMRVLVWVLAALMLLGVAIPVITGFLSYNVRAVYITDTDDTIVRIGLLYGTNTVPAFLTRSPYGFRVCAVNRETDEVVDLYSLDSTSLEATVDKNLLCQYGDYVPTEDEGDIGAYHAMLDFSLNQDELYMAMHVAVMNGADVPLTAAYADGAYRLLVGNFSSFDAAQEYIDNADNIFEGFTVADDLEITEMTVREPSETAVSLLDPETNLTVFIFDGGDEWDVGLMAIDSPEGERAYLQTPANKLYDGIFLFSRYKDGIQLVNYLALEDYVMGVLPYEISNSWPLETQKAFAIAVRSYSVNKFGRHQKTYGFDMCNTGCCQTYNGVRNVNDTVRRAVNETEDIVLVSDEGEIISTYYSAVAGGTTVSAKDAWVGDVSYLQSKATPWEDYSSHPNGTWTWSVSPSKLRDVLVSLGHSELKGEIEDIEVTYAENSDYANKIVFTDEYGNTSVINKADTIRTELYTYIKSANFKVGKGSVTINDPAFADDGAKVYFSMINGDNKIGYINWTQPMKILSSKGEGYTWASPATPVITGGGEVKYVDRTITLEADSPDDFLFVGRGWGHGVGLSQVGAYCLGIQGFDARFILNAYFEDTYFDLYSNILAYREYEESLLEEEELFEDEE